MTWREELAALRPSKTGSGSTQSSYRGFLLQDPVGTPGWDIGWRAVRPDAALPALMVGLTGHMHSNGQNLRLEDVALFLVFLDSVYM